MDKAWKTVFNENAAKDIPDYQASCWTKDGFDERLALFPKLLDKVQVTIKKNNLPPLQSALDVGCGPGAYCDLLHEKGFTVTGVDYAENMLYRARHSTNKAIRYIKADAYDLPFNKKSFDLVISIGALQCVEHYERFMRELCKTARVAIIISTLRTTSKTNPSIRLQNQLCYDSWPTRTYHPDTFINFFENEGFATKLVLKNSAGAILSDSFFILAIRKSFLSDKAIF